MTLTPFSATLNNGTRVTIREVTQADRPLLEVGFAHLSDRAKYFRFLSTRNDLTPAELDRFTASNGPDHIAIGALVEGTTPPEPIGIARYIRLPQMPQSGDTRADITAEIAITIVDRYQHQGLGRLLLDELSILATRNGITAFSALVHSENRAMLGLLAQRGGKLSRLSGSEVEVRLALT